ncbi:helix-turn-helix transcriptional regulator [Mesobacillus stamsii]|uniref:DNA-binding XRE family transcriptional regulator n=1 Tax=Mesobacillus stamsii TaxID=225347 RepID=A0ABU0FSV2_9BACI|nr:helix-turn-helix transcriptional regulator [Mesobacillus stamsii]MDQ0412676.1 DNA-binding XRE family transcriptional regulator [Mesobacillus stamsii]
MPYKVVCCRVPSHLRRKRWTQQELADRVGLTKQAMSKIVNNANIMSYETAYSVAKELGCRMEDLYEVRYIGNKE